jgi:hypothetical protein
MVPSCEELADMLIREALARFYDMHQRYKTGTLGSPEAVAAYEAEREAFTRAFVGAQQLALRAGQSARQSLRVARAERLVLAIGARRETTVTADVGVGGFSALVGPLAVRIVCDFELGSPPDVVRGRARVVASAAQPGGGSRTSFAIDAMAEDDKRRLEIAVIDAALISLVPRSK